MLRSVGAFVLSVAERIEINLPLLLSALTSQILHSLQLFVVSSSTWLCVTLLWLSCLLLALGDVLLLTDIPLSAGWRQEMLC